MWRCGYHVADINYMQTIWMFSAECQRTVVLERSMELSCSCHLSLLILLIGNFVMYFHIGECSQMWPLNNEELYNIKFLIITFTGILSNECCTLQNEGFLIIIILFSPITLLWWIVTYSSSTTQTTMFSMNISCERLQQTIRCILVTNNIGVAVRNSEC